MSDQRKCCYILDQDNPNPENMVSCSRLAEFAIYGESGHPEDYTEACEEHVGPLLGSPLGVPANGVRSWKVWALSDVALEEPR